MIIMKPGNYTNEYYGLSGDEKPYDEFVPNASLFLEIDTGDLYLFDRENGEWLLWNAGSGGGGSGGDINVQPLSVKKNGTYKAPSGRAYSPVNVNVPQTEVSPLSVTTNGTYTAEDGEAYSPVTVSVPQTTLRSLTATENKTYSAPDGSAYSRVTVNVPKDGADAQALSVTENGTYTAPSGVAYTPVTVNVPQTDVEPLTVRANGTYTPAEGTAYGPVTVNVPTEGGATEAAEWNDVNFIDYDGSVRYSYTAEEFATLSVMPANPIHGVLTAQGWNWNMADAKAYVAKYKKLIIGQMYTTSDGKTRIYTRIERAFPGSQIPATYILFHIPSGKTVEVDWGDGTAPVTYDSSSAEIKEHQYSDEGNYTIAISGTEYSIDPAVGSSIYGETSSAASYLRRTQIVGIHVGNGVTVGYYAFDRCPSLRFVTLPEDALNNSLDLFYYSNLLSFTFCSGHASIGNDALTGNYGLRSIAIPSGVSGIGRYAFQECRSLYEVTIPDTVTSIETYAFNNCISLISVVMPDSITAIGARAFYGCSSLVSLHLHSVTPPVLGNSDAFDETALKRLDNGYIFVPYSEDHSILNAYRSATNWSTLKSKILEEETT